MIDGFNATASEIPRSFIVAAADPGGVPAAPLATGGAALSVSGLSAPPRTRRAGLTKVYPLPLLLVLGGTWAAACTITVKSPKGDVNIDVTAGAAGPVDTGAATFLHSDITEIVTDKDPGPGATLQVAWLCPRCVKPVGTAQPLGVTANPIKAGVFQGVQEANGALVSIVVEDDASIALGDDVFVLPSGKVRELRAGDTTGYKIPGAGRLAVAPDGPGKVVPILWRPQAI